jgi:hypothetical protein
MIKSLVVVFALSLFQLSAHAEDKSSGCGLGWKVTKRNSLVSSTVRSYTNMIGSQSSGMTSGTSGCDRHSIVKTEKAPLHFVEANRESLMIDMAKGHGEYLTAFAQVMGCSRESVSHFSSAAQKRSTSLLSAEEVSDTQIIETIQSTISEDPQLTVSCSQSV